MEELFRFINVSCETSRFYLRNFSFMFGRGELIAISSDTTSAKDALVLLLTRQIEPTSGKISWNAKGGAHSLISYENHLLYKHLSIAENLSLTYPSSNRFFFSQKRNSLNARLILEKYGIFWDVNKPVYSLTKLQQYILSIVKAVYLGAEYLILSDVVRLHYDADFSLLRDLVRTLLEYQISILLTDSYQNPLFICSDACRILRFEGGMFVRLVNGQEDQYIYDSYRSYDSSAYASVYPQKNVPLSIDFSSITISDIHTNHIHSLSMNLQPGEITYLVGKGLYEYDFLNAIFGEVPRFRINLGNKDFINAKISTLFYAGIGYFPQDVSRLIFPDLNYFENTTIFSLRRISYLGTVVRSAFQNYLLTKQPFSYKEDPKHPFYKINYENRIVAAANRYALYNWRLLIIHLPNINPTGVESRIFQTLIDDLANRGTSVLVVVAASSEILTRADNLFEFDQEGNCYQKLDHQNHRLQK